MQRIPHLIMISSTCLLAALAGSDVSAADDTASDKSANVRPAQHSSERAAAKGEQAPAGEQRKQSAAEVAREAGLDRYGAEQIKQLQRELAARGAYQGRVDGVAGPMTVAALRNFQIQQKLDTSGGLNAETRDALGLSWERVEVSGRDTSTTEATGQNATVASPAGNDATSAPPGGSVQRPEPKVMPSLNTLELRSLDGEQARRVQQRLRDLGYYNGALDGVLGEQSQSALQRLFNDQAALAARGQVSGAMLGWLGQEPPAGAAR